MYPISQRRALERDPVPALRLLVLPRLQHRHRLLLGERQERRPDLLRRLLVEARQRLRPRAALRAAVAPSQRDVPHIRLRREGRRGARLRPRLERAADPARQGQGLPSTSASTATSCSSSATRTTSTRATSRTQRWRVRSEGPEAGRCSPPTPTPPAPISAPTTRTSTAACPASALRRFPRQIGWGKVVVGLRGHRRAAPVRGRGERGLLGAFRRGPLHLAALRPELPRVHAVGRVTDTRATARATARRSTRTGTSSPRSSARPSTARSTRRRVEMRGPTFAKVWDTPGFAYSERFKHVIGPEVSWTYRSRVEDYNSIPKFDGNDYFLGTNQINYSLVQRFFAKRARPVRQVTALRVPDLAADADLLRADLQRSEQLRPQLLVVLRTGPACEAGAPLAPVVAAEAETDAGLLDRLRRGVRRELQAVPPQQRVRHLQRVAGLAPGGLGAVGAPLRERRGERVVGSHTLRGQAGIELVAEAPVPRGLGRLRHQERHPVPVPHAGALRRSSAAASRSSTSATTTTGATRSSGASTSTSRTSARWAISSAPERAARAAPTGEAARHRCRRLRRRPPARAAAPRRSRRRASTASSRRAAACRAPRPQGRPLSSRPTSTTLRRPPRWSRRRDPTPVVHLAGAVERPAIVARSRRHAAHQRARRSCTCWTRCGARGAQAGGARRRQRRGVRIGARRPSCRSAGRRRCGRPRPMPSARRRRRRSPCSTVRRGACASC